MRDTLARVDRALDISRRMTAVSTEVDAALDAYRAEPTPDRLAALAAARGRLNALTDEARAHTTIGGPANRGGK